MSKYAIVISIFLLTHSFSQVSNANHAPNHCKELLENKLQPDNDNFLFSSFSSELEKLEKLEELKQMSKFLIGGKQLWKKDPTNFFKTLLYFLEISSMVDSGYREIDEVVAFYKNGIDFISSLSAKTTAKFATEISIAALNFSQRSMTEVEQLKTLKSTLNKSLTQRKRNSLTRKQIANLLLVETFIMDFISPSVSISPSVNISPSNQTDSNQTDSNQTDSNQVDSNQADSNQADSNQTDSNQADSNQTNSNQADSNQADSNQTDSSAISEEFKTKIESLEELDLYKDELQAFPLESDLTNYTLNTYQMYQLMVLMALIDAAEIGNFDFILRAIDLVISFNRPILEPDVSISFNEVLIVDLAAALEFIKENESNLPSNSYQKIQASLEMILPDSATIDLFLRRLKEHKTQQTDNYDLLKEKIEAIGDDDVRAEMYLKIFMKTFLERLQVDNNLTKQVFTIEASLTNNDQEKILEEFSDLAYAANPKDMNIHVNYLIQKFSKRSNEDDLDELIKIFLQVSNYLLNLSFALDDPDVFIVPENTLPYLISFKTLGELMMFLNRFPPQKIAPFILSNLDDIVVSESVIEQIKRELNEKSLVFLPLIMGATMLHMKLRENPSRILEIDSSYVFELISANLIDELYLFFDDLGKIGLLDNYPDYFQIQRSN